MEKNTKEMNNESLKPKSVFAEELWFTGKSEELASLQEKMNANELTATIRMGDRSPLTTDPKGGCGEGRYITIKLQNPDGTFDSFEKRVTINSSLMKNFGDIIASDLVGTLFDGKTKDELRERLQTVYKRPISDNDMVTIVRFEYQDKLQSVDDLVRNKVFSYANKPERNPTNLDFNQYTISLIKDDYAAKTPVMWVTVYDKYLNHDIADTKNAKNKDIGNIMFVGNPEFTKEILEVLKRDPKYLGGGAGVGFKDEVIKYLDELDDTAKDIGSVNFILKTADGKLRGYNTDGLGYAQGLEEVLVKQKKEVEGKRVVILGAGGTGISIAFALAERGAIITILNRTVAKAENLAKAINKKLGKEVAFFGGENEVADKVKEADVVINVSTKGAAGAFKEYSALAPASLPATPENIQKNLAEAGNILKTIPKGTIISDIVLVETVTPFLKSAGEEGYTTLNGIPMVINQGVEAFWILHGKDLKERGVTKEQVAKVMKEAAYQE